MALSSTLNAPPSRGRLYHLPGKRLSSVLIYRMESKRTLLAIIAGCVVAVAIGFHLVRKEPHSTNSTADLRLAHTPATPPNIDSAEATVPIGLPFPLHLLKATEFNQYDQELNLTLEPRYLLFITENEAASVNQAALQLRDSFEPAQAKSIRAAQYPDLLYENTPFFYAEVDPLGSLANSLIGTYRTQLKDALGADRASFINAPFEVSPENTILFIKMSAAPPRNNEVKVV